MASIVLSTLWLNDAADLTDYRAFPLMAELEVTTSKSVEQRRYANGRLRMVSRAGLRREASATLTHCTREQVEWLESKVGRVLLVRDDRGRKFYGSFAAVGVEEHAYNIEADVSLDIAEVSVAEAV